MRLILLLLIAVFAFGCGQTASDAPKVVVYTALDREFSEPILKDFEAQTGIAVEAVYDTEAVKTVGLVNRLIAERDRPTADIFWNNEILRSLQLKRMGLTTPYSVENAEGIPAELKDPEGHWVGFASRARVILVNTDLLPNEADHPTRVEDLLDPKWKGKAGFAKPLFGTTSTHAAVLWAEQGGPATTAFFTQALENAEMYPGNAQVRDAVAAGEIVWCLTDTDDAYGALVDGKPVRMIYPDTKPGEAGMVVLPNTLVKIAGGPNPDAADALLNYLLSAEVEAKLAQSRSAQIPVRPGVPGPKGIQPLEGLVLRSIDWAKVDSTLEESQKALAELLQNP